MLKCSKCGGKLAVKDVVHNDADNEIYRRRVCSDCGAIVYTTEFVVEASRDYLSLYNSYHRKAKKSRVSPGQLTFNDSF